VNKWEPEILNTETLRGKNIDLRRQEGYYHNVFKIEKSLPLLWKRKKPQEGVDYRECNGRAKKRKERIAPRIHRSEIRGIQLKYKTAFIGEKEKRGKERWSQGGGNLH